MVFQKLFPAGIAIRSLAIVLGLFLFCSSAKAQKDSTSLERGIADEFIAAYNRQEYVAMRAHFSKPIGLILSKGKMRDAWGDRYAKYGKMVVRPEDIDVAGGNVRINLRYEKDTSFRETINFFISGKGRIEGIGFRPDYYLFPIPAQPVADAGAAVDSILAEYYPRGFSGTVLFSAGDAVVFQKNYGFNDPQNRSPVNDSSVFEIASNSKQFTAAAILRLQELGKLSVEDSLRKFFPELPYNGVTVRHLVHHTGGLPDYMERLAGKKSPCGTYCYNTDIVTWMAADKPKADFTPGKRFEYSNTGYALLAAIIEKASGQSYADFLREQFFIPLGMTHTRVYNTRRTAGEVIPNYAYGTVWDGKTKRFHIPDSLKDYSYVIRLDGITGDGTVNTTARDLVRWDRGLNTGAVLSKASLDSAYTPGKTASGAATTYGYGLSIARRDNAGLILTHTGGWPGYGTLIYRFPEKDKMLVILSNREDDDNNIVMAARKITGLFITR